MGTMILAGILSGFVGGYIISLFWAGPRLPWQAIDKNIGLESAIRAIIAGDLLAMAFATLSFTAHLYKWRGIETPRARRVSLGLRAE